MSPEQFKEFTELIRQLNSMLQAPEWGLHSWCSILGAKMKKLNEFMDIWYAS